MLNYGILGVEVLHIGRRFSWFAMTIFENKKKRNGVLALTLALIFFAGVFVFFGAGIVHAESGSVGYNSAVQLGEAAASKSGRGLF